MPKSDWFTHEIIENVSQDGIWLTNKVDFVCGACVFAKMLISSITAQANINSFDADGMLNSTQSISQPHLI